VRASGVAAYSRFDTQGANEGFSKSYFGALLSSDMRCGH
jgi:hypothetical protein